MSKKISDFLDPDIPVNSITFEQCLRDPDFMKKFQDYIFKTIIPTCMTDYDDDNDNNGSDTDQNILEMKKMLLNESFFIFSNLLVIFIKYNNRYVSFPDHMEYNPIKKIGDNTHDNNNPFEKNEFLSQVFFMLVRICDFMNTFFMDQIYFFDKKIEYVNAIIHDQDHNDITFESILMKLHMSRMRDQMISQCENTKKDLEMFFDISKPLREYILRILQNISYQTNSGNEMYFFPEQTLNVFSTTQIFIDHDFARFIMRYDTWFPTSMRSTYIRNILLNKSFGAQLTHKDFNVTMKTGTDDIFYLYELYQKDSNYVKDICIIVNILTQKITNKCLEIEDIGSSRFQKLVSVMYEIISKVFDEISMDQANEIHDLLIEEVLCFVRLVIFDYPSILDSYVLYQTLITLIPIGLKYADHSHRYIFMYIYDILQILFDNSYDDKNIACWYLVSIYDEETVQSVVDDKFRMIFHEKKRSQIKEIICENKQIEEMDDNNTRIDPITNNTIVIFCLIPMDNDHKITAVCDKYAIQSCLWNKPENPFTRQPLNLNDLDTFNQRPENKEKIEQILKMIHEKS
jgi:hypothetical protein